VTLFKYIKSMVKKIFPNMFKSNTESNSNEFIEANEELTLFESDPKLKKATFAGGCFWCMEGPLESVTGVRGAVLGYTGGGRETALTFYDPEITKYRDLVEMYFKFIDPTDPDGQFTDRGSRYHLGIFYHTPEQEMIARDYIKEVEVSGKYDKPITVEVLPAQDFKLAEDRHQNFYKKQSKNYKEYYKGSGRQAFVESNNEK
jgi:peptide methionine sulfoxide reductase msrA/msrB